MLTNGTDEAIQVLINTFVDDGDDVLTLKPSYAMYRFYAELAGRAGARNRISGGSVVSARRASRCDHAEDEGDPDRQSQ